MDGLLDFLRALAVHRAEQLERVLERVAVAEHVALRGDRALEREAESLRLRIPKDALRIAMCIEGRRLDSRQFADFVVSRVKGQKGLK